MPKAGLGTVKFGRNQGVKYPSAFDLPDDSSIKNLLALAKELGIHLLDTAPAYGSSESRIGKLLTHRHDWLICSKVGESFHNGQSDFDFSATAVRDSVYRSLKRLRSDYLDMVLIHSDGRDVDILNNGETVEALTRLKQEGLIRAIGLSGKTVAGGIAALTDFGMDAVMVTYHPCDRAEKSVIDTAVGLQKNVLIKKAFAGGHLQQLDSQPDDDPIQHSIDFIFSDADSVPYLSVILGTINPDHLRHNANAIATALAQYPIENH